MRIECINVGQVFGIKRAFVHTGPEFSMVSDYGQSQGGSTGSI